MKEKQARRKLAFDWLVRYSPVQSNRLVSTLEFLPQRVNVFDLPDTKLLHPTLLAQIRHILAWASSRDRDDNNRADDDTDSERGINDGADDHTTIIITEVDGNLTIAQTCLSAIPTSMRLARVEHALHNM